MTAGTVVPAPKISLSCTDGVDTVNLYMDTVVECLSAVCDASKFDDHIASLNDNPELKALADSLGLTCTIGTGEPGSGGGSGAFSTGSVAEAAAVVATLAAALVL